MFESVTLYYIWILFLPRSVVQARAKVTIVLSTKVTIVLSTSHGKVIFAWRFILNETIMF